MNLTDKIIKGIIWSMLERLSIQGVQFVVGIILARILSPSEYGTIGLLTVIIAFLQVFIDSGFSKALIQKQDRTQSDLSTIFFFNVLISVMFYVILWFVSPFIAEFYNNVMLIDLMRVLSLSILFSSLFSIPMTLFTIELNFKSIARSNLIAVVISGIVSIIMAFNGFGVWALVIQTVIKSILTLILIWAQIKWKPNFVFSQESFKLLFSYGSKLLLSSILNTSVNNFSNLIIAKLSSTKDLGFFTRGTQFADLVYGTFSSVLDSVLLPSLATIQHDRDKLIELTRFTIKSTAVIVTPVLLGLVIIAEPLIKILLTDKWLLAVPIMQIFCIARLVTIISGINVNLLYVVGRTDLALRQQYVKLIVRILLLTIAIKFGIIYLAIAELISTLIHFFINTYYPGKILNYGSIEQIIDLFPSLIFSCIMALIMKFSMFFIENIIIKLIIGIMISFPVYFFLLRVFKVNEFFVLLSKVKLVFKIKER